MEPEIVCGEISEKDLRPEYCQYRDEGCELSGSCLQCRLSHCIYDQPQGKRRMLKAMRDRKIVGLFHKGKKTKELAAMFNITRRTVQRILKSSKSASRNTKNAK